ncbi:ABC transporter substrate-binding protein [Variovorax sp.]|uniref:MlaC/ttg2D family ABC transporter substrate-binding protein n=1 Tax=Variovorax sp. TaxID=1871043 RepID=UPI002D456588|nr:ABC transporter substrate-binding protein [Variovorax sp.]HYP82380.1 ABC transporter substrate-binding protein [Variovorax sp.]
MHNKAHASASTLAQPGRRGFGRWLLAALLLAGAAAGFAPAARAADEAPDALVRRLTNETLQQIRSDSSLKSGDMSKVMALVETRILPNVDFQRMTASTVGPKWREATGEQKQRLQEQFKLLLVRTYAGALAQVTDQEVVVKPFRGSADDKEVLVRSEVRSGSNEPIQIDYRLEKTPGESGGWKIFNLNVMGIWLVDTYRSQFIQEINSKGIDGLIATLEARNKSMAAGGNAKS